ncbi:prohibitin family protein [bacterium]|nr:prohibitin family protein [bacterium]MBU3930264.1 prohibitin family protein [bacterium]MBU4123147.1 prohibitin family protein [bacterium]
MDQYEMQAKFGKGIGFFVMLFIVFVILMKSLVVVQPGTVGVRVLFGKVNPKTLKSGLHLINPLVNVVKMSVRTEEYTMSIASAEGYKSGDDAIDALTSEGMKIRLDLTAWYRLDEAKAAQVYETIGTNYESKIVRPVLRTAIRDAVVKYTAASIYTEKRAQLVSDIERIMAELLKDRGIISEKILLRNLILPKRLMEAIDIKLSAEQAAQQMEFVVMKERKEKERKIVEAEGIRRANQIISSGLTDKYIKWYRIDMMKQLVDSPNNTIIFIPEDMSSTPIINIPAQK